MSRLIIAVAVCLAVACAMPVIAEDEHPVAETARNDAYAGKLWQYMIDHKLVGDDRVRSFPFEGSRSHGSIQEIVTTQATIERHQGRLIVKHNYGAEHGLTPKSVYSAQQSQNYIALTIMFQREPGYDAANSDWFWAEYESTGVVIEHQGAHLSGRAPFCLSCHTPLGGKDREILNGNGR